MSNRKRLLNRKHALVLIGLALVMVLGVYGLSGVGAVTPGLYEVEGNPNCGILYEATVISGPDPDLLGLGPLFGLKYNANPTGDVSSTLTDNAPWVVTNGPQDPNNTVWISNVILSDGEGVQFDWSATLGLDAVIVKAQDANAYVYSPEAFGASGLVAPDGKGISHIEFCYDYELAAEKTADAEYTRTYTWTITKDFDGEYWKFIGDPATSHDYKVGVDQTITDSAFAVSGTITVKNPSPYAVTFGVTDFVDGTAALVSCPTYDLAPNDGVAGGADEVTCTYTASLDGPVDGTNTATVTSNITEVKPATSTADYAFGDPTTTVGNPDINVTDTNGGAWTASGDASWNYSKDFECSADPAAYTGGTYSYTHDNTATITETGQFDDATVTVNCYIPSISKTAAGTYDERHEWTVLKTVDPASQSAFAGDTVTFDWTITVDETIFEENFDVSGTITVNNPNTEDVLVVSLVDWVNGNAATIDQSSCAFDGTDLTVAAGGSETCDYAANDLPYDDVTLAPDTNTATITLNGIDFEATDLIEYTANVIRGSATLDDDQFPYSGESVYDGWTSTYEDNYTCSSNLDDYTGGSDLDNQVSNTAEVYSEDSLQDDDTATTEIDCYIPSISKTADGTYDERHEWTVEKTVDPGSQSAFAGDTVTFDWTITVGETVTEENFDVSGTITVNNPNTEDALVVSLVDWLNGHQATIDQTSCAFDGTNLTVAAGGSETCDYDANDLPYTALADAPTLNTATITLNGIDFVATDPIEYTVTVINDSAWLDDDWKYEDEPVNDGWNDTYGGSYTCSTDLNDYTDGADLDNEVSNTAEVWSDGGLEDSSTATTEIDCYIPSITKTAAGTYDERHEWDVEKTVDPFDQSGYPGDVLPWTWTIDVIEDVYEENFDVAGTITVGNPNTEDVLVVSLVDWVNGNAATIDQTSCVFDGTYLTVAAGGSETCDYDANDLPYTALADAPTLNTATITLNGIDFVATDPIEYTANVIRGTATLSDTEIGLTNELVSGGDQFTGSDSHTCSEFKRDYDEFGQYGDTVTNWAYLTDSEGTVYDDDATTEWLCEAGFVDVLKWTDGLVDPTQDWKFALFVGPDGFGGTQVGATDSTLYDPDGVLDFDGLENPPPPDPPTVKVPVPALRPDTNYTVCELEVPAGWSSFWQVDIGDGSGFTTVIPYNPNADDDPPEDLGNRCVDFGAGTTMPVTVGTTIRFQIDNTYPGGAPRTPGYWKNWNGCTGGGQFDTAATNGGWDEGFWLLEDVLDPLIGGGIVWDDILEPQDPEASEYFNESGFFTIDSCEVAVDILDKRKVADPLLLGDGKKAASDPLHNLATHLLAAQLNFGAGACTPEDPIYGETTIEDIVMEAETLLDSYDFDGNQPKMGKKDSNAQVANELATYIDDYNNGEYCDGS